MSGKLPKGVIEDHVRALSLVPPAKGYNEISRGLEPPETQQVREAINWIRAEPSNSDEQLEQLDSEEALDQIKGKWEAHATEMTNRLGQMNTVTLAAYAKKRKFKEVARKIRAKLPSDYEYLKPKDVADKILKGHSEDINELLGLSGSGSSVSREILAESFAQYFAAPRKFKGLIGKIRGKLNEQLHSQNTNIDQQLDSEKGKLALDQILKGL